jgi:aminopeptidase-like protein
VLQDISADAGTRLHDLVARLFPLPRSLTGDGVRQTLAVVAEHLPLEVHEVATGTRVLDWTVPQEWRVRGGRVLRPDGSVLVDWADGPLHLVGHSEPFRGRLSLHDLLPHLHTLPDRPTLTPYRTSYYKATWGFCLPHERLQGLPEGEYDVVVDTELVDGHLTYGELVLPGEEPGEVLVTAHVCHPARPTTTCPASRSPWAWRSCCWPLRDVDGPTGSCSPPARWERSRGWRPTATPRSACTPAWS